MTGGGVEHIDETVIFGGVLINHFGHSILESISRLWYVLVNDTTERIAILADPYLTLPDLAKVYNDIFSLLDIDLKRIILIEKPTQFKRVIVPDETVYAYGSHRHYKRQYTVVHEKMMSRVEAKDVKKIYFTRRQLKKHDVFGEEYFEEFYRKRGYTVLVPEQFTIKEMVAYMKGAEEVACIVGTSMVFLLFARPGTKFTGLVRIEHIDNDLNCFFLVLQSKSLDYRMVDVSYNILPVHHSGPCFILGPSRQWREYLDSINVKCAKDELEWDIGKYAFDFLKRWASAMSNASFIRLMTLFDNFDVLNSVVTALLDKPLNIEDYKPISYKEREKVLLADMERLKGDIADPDIKRLEDEIQRLEAENRRLEIAADELRRIKRSATWQIGSRLVKIVTPLLGKRKEKVRALLNRKK